MKLRKKAAVFFMAVLVMTITVLGTSQIQASAATKTYSFSSCNVKSFKKSGGRLTIKLKGATFEKGNRKTIFTSLRFKMSKNCKFYNKTFERYSGGYSYERTSYKSVKKSIAFDRSYFVNTRNYNNVGMSSIKVKNGKIVKVIYFSA